MNNSTRKVLPEGQYILTSDVENPSADRRHKRSVEYMVTWTAGMKFDVQVNHFNYGHTKVDYNIIKGVGWYGRLSSNNDAFDALVAALVPVERTTESLARKAEKNYVGTGEFFDALLEEHGWTLDQIEDLVNTTIAREDAKEES